MTEDASLEAIFIEELPENPDACRLETYSHAFLQADFTDSGYDRQAGQSEIYII